MAGIAKRGISPKDADEITPYNNPFNLFITI